MNPRLCFVVVLLSPHISSAWMNNSLRCSVIIHKHVLMPAYDIWVYVLNTNLIRQLTVPLAYLGPAYRREYIMQPDYGLLPNSRAASTSNNAMYKFNELRTYVTQGQIFRLDEEAYFQLLHRAYITELEYLQTAFVAVVDSGSKLRTKAPCEYLFGTRYGEVDRTMTGLNALRWILQEDYNSYTHNQPPNTKLSRKTFGKIRSLFKKYMTPQQIFTLITMQMTNDLGKSSHLQNLYHEAMQGGSEIQVNHDMMMYHIVRDRPNLVPSFQALPPFEQKLMQDLLCVSAEFNAPQLIQAESPPEAMLILQEQNWSPDLVQEALERKFLEIILDMSGALGQINHEGAMTMTEPVATSLLHCLEVSKLVAGHQITPHEAYHQVLEYRLALLETSGWKRRFDIRSNPSHFAKARLLCMGRADNPETANLFEQVYDTLPFESQQDLQWGLSIDHKIARQATYMPNMIANSKTPAQLKVSFEYLARVLFISDSDLNALPRDNDGNLPTGLVILERDVLPIVKPLMRDGAFRENPSSLVNGNTPLPRLQIMKQSRDRDVPLLGDEWARAQFRGCHVPARE